VVPTLVHLARSHSPESDVCCPKHTFTLSVGTFTWVGTVRAGAPAEAAMVHWPAFTAPSSRDSPLPQANAPVATKRPATRIQKKLRSFNGSSFIGLPFHPLDGWIAADVWS